MSKNTRTPVATRMVSSLKPLALVLALSAVVPHALAQETAPAAPIDPNAVVATINGEDITEADVAYVAEDLGQELASVAPENRRTLLIKLMVDMRVMANAARAENMQDSDEFQRRQRYLEDRTLRRTYLADKVGSVVTEENVRAEYDAFVDSFTPQEEVRARHILVTDEEDAKSIRAEIEAGKPFEVAAMENSIDGSAQNGGDLGYFGRGQMVPPFEEAAFALETGAMSEPVQSQFGWHIIKLEDKRESTPPPFEQVANQLQQKVFADKFNEITAALKAEADVEYADDAIAEAIATFEAGQN